MAEENGEGSEEQPPEPGTGRSLQRTPPIIEAKAEEDREGADTHALPPQNDSEVEKRQSPWRGFWTFLLAILCGAVLAVGGEWALLTFERPELLGMQGSNDLQAFKTRLAELEKGFQRSEEKRDAGLTSVREELGRIEQLDQRLSTAENTVASHTDTLNQVQESQHTLQPAQTMTEQADRVETSGAEREQIDLIDKRVSGIEQDVAQLREEGHKTEQATAALQAQDPHAYDDRLNLLEHQIATLQQTVTQAKIDIRMLRETQQESSDNRRKRLESLAILGGSLVDKILRGMPYQDEVEALDGLGADKAKLAALQPNAGTGVASARGLRDQFAALSKSLAAPPPAKPDEGFLARIGQEAASLIHVKRLDGTGSKDVPDLIRSIETALAQDRLDEALSLWNELPAEAKAKSEAFAKALQTRIDALHEARAIEADALLALGRQKS